MIDSDKAVVEKATVKFEKLGGQGVLVPGGYIITAAHCIKWSSAGEMVLGQEFAQEMETNKGTIKAMPLAVEPVADIAVLGPLPIERSPVEHNHFQRFCEDTEPVPVCVTEDYELFNTFSIYFYNHCGRFISGTAQLCAASAANFWLNADEIIEGGTSGSPVVNDSGELVGIISNSTDDESDGGIPRPNYALPIWVYKLICEAQAVIE